MKNPPFHDRSQLFYTYRRMVRVRSLLVVIAIMSLVSIASADEIDVWIGAGDGVYHLTLDTEKGALSSPSMAFPMKGAGFLAMHPDQSVLYATDRAEQGAVTAFTISPEKRLKRINTMATGDGGPACVGIDKTGTVLMSAQYGGGSATTYLLKPDGSLDARVQVVEHGAGSGVVKNRQKTAHPHWVGTSPDNRFLLVPDLGLDRVVVYSLDSKTGKLTPHTKIAVPPGSGPRHMKFHTSVQFIYVLNELTLTISVFSYDSEKGEFKEIQLIETLPAELKDQHLNSAAEIRVHPSGQFVYASNRGHDTIACFRVDPETGMLSFIDREPIRGSIPRNFNLDPSGRWLIAAGQASNTLALFAVDPETGKLTFHRQVVNVPAPICVLFESE